MSSSVRGELAKRRRIEKPAPAGVNALDKASRLLIPYQLPRVVPAIQELPFCQVIRDAQQWTRMGWWQLGCTCRGLATAPGYAICKKINTLYYERLAAQYCFAVGVMDHVAAPVIPTHLLSEAGELLKRIENRTSVRGETDLMRASREGNADRIEELLALGVDVNATSRHGSTSLMEAVMHSTEQVVRLLLDGQANPNAMDRYGVSVLDEATTPRDSRIFELLLLRKANVNRAAQDGTTPLMLASRMNCPELVRLLISAKALVNQTDGEGRTALMRAASNAGQAAIKELLSHGADLNVKAAAGQTALSVATHNRCTDAMQLLLEARANPSEGKNS
jgi:ankyrin repeat protein